MGKAEGYSYDERLAKNQAAKNLLSTEKAIEIMKKVTAKYAWASVEHKNRKLLAKLLVIRAEAIASLLLYDSSAEMCNRCNAISKKMAVLLADFDA